MRSTEKPYEVIVEGQLAQGALDHVYNAQCSEAFDLVIVCADEYLVLPSSNKLVIPFDDSTDGVPVSTLLLLQYVIAGIEGRELNVLTVCHMGENRSGFVSALILMFEGYSAEDAISLIREKVSPLTDNPYTLWNEGFVKQLKEMYNG